MPRSASISAWRRPRPGFTLVEILVVIVIIVILAAVVFGVSRRGVDAARATTCMSNLRQVGMAMLSYASDKSGELPPLEDRGGEGDQLKGWWTSIIADGGHLPRVINNTGRNSTGAGVWACPNCTDVRGTGSGKEEVNYNGYGVAEGTVMKVKLGSVPSQRSLRLSEIPRPERTWLVGDAVTSPEKLETGWYAIWANPAKWNGKSPGARHRGKVNVCMVDGHVESLTLKEMKDPKKEYYTMFK